MKHRILSALTAGVLAASALTLTATPAQAWSWPDQRTVGCWLMFGNC